jgi:DNA-binding transcriptional regulator YiaG
MGRRTDLRRDSASFRAALTALGLTQATAAEVLGVGKRTVRRWCHSGPRGPAEILLRLLEDGRLPLQGAHLPCKMLNKVT